MKTNRPAVRYGCLIFAGALLGGTPAAIQGQETAGATSAGAAVISNLAITQETQRAVVRVQGAGRLDVHAARMQNPERLVLDFSGARLGLQKTTVTGEATPVRDVRAGQFRPDVARVVIDLAAAAPYQLAHEGDTLVVYIQTEAAVSVDSAKTAATTEKKEIA